MMRAIWIRTITALVVLSAIPAAAQQPGVRPIGPPNAARPNPVAGPAVPGPQSNQNPALPGTGGARPDTGPINPQAGQGILQCPFPTPAASELQLIDQVLTAWEKRSGEIERYRCDFERWEYDPIFGPRDPKESKTYAVGKVQYQKPDKGLFRVDKMETYVSPKKEGDKPTWSKTDGLSNPHWVCDGANVFEFNAQALQLIQRPLPPEMQGKAIVDGPLPFLFGAKSETIKSRYWLRRVTPAGVTGEFWLEAAPKYRADAANYKMIHIIVDEQEFLPKAMQMFDPSYDPQKRAIRTVFTFSNREVNWNTTVQNLNIFHREFFEPKVPLGWKKVIEPLAGPADPNVAQDAPGPIGAPGGANGVPAQAERPKSKGFTLPFYKKQ